EITFTNPTKTGYTFEGWFTESSFTNSITKIELGSTGNVDVYAQWIAKTTSISFNFQGGQDGSNEVSATFGSAMPSGINAPASDNYNFLGYFDRSSGGNQYYDKDMNSAKNWDKEGITGILFAQWEPKTYTITFDPNNGAGGPAPVQAVTNQYLPDLTYPGDIPTRVSYDFMGYEDSMGTSYYDETLTPILTWRAAEDFTLYARWAVIEP
ncbi:MAG: hypothetical protein EOM67_12940, partial [Spirochaetia bacterium]|nr:hypothetical protein [Spirochaetia bacterium]